MKAFVGELGEGDIVPQLGQPGRLAGTCGAGRDILSPEARAEAGFSPIRLSCLHSPVEL